MLQVLKRFAIGMTLLIAALWAGNSSSLVSGLEQHKTRLIAHRGVHQIYVGADRSNSACHAAPVAPLRHNFIENTLPSMKEAFRLGADVVEIDVHLTTDRIFAVFHDWTVDCRTDGTGVTRQQRFADLAMLDIGYHYDDGSETYPLRGRGVGLMPSLEQVFDQNSTGAFLINFKSRRREDGLALATLLDNPRHLSQVYGVYGGDAPTQAAIAQVPNLRGFGRMSLRTCLLHYAVSGWSGYMPPSCHNTIVLIPQNYAPLLWGWPHRLTRRFKAVGTDVILVGPYDGSGFASGIDNATTFDKVPVAFDGYIWTNRIEVIGPLHAVNRN
ncbi:MAG: glycerophosphodiester phosphodiesterase family protein [Pseudomonadota bacterium]